MPCCLVIIDFALLDTQVEKQRELTFVIQRLAVAKAIKDGLNTRLVGLSTGLEAKFTVKTKGSTPPRVETNPQVLDVIKRVCGAR